MAERKGNGYHKKFEAYAMYVLRSDVPGTENFLSRVGQLEAQAAREVRAEFGARRQPITLQEAEDVVGKRLFRRAAQLGPRVGAMA
ncbi:MAG: hypothetical protein Q8R11_03320 [bacterium]|nr:hypothetical protein [bacterium]